MYVPAHVVLYICMQRTVAERSCGNQEMYRYRVVRCGQCACIVRGWLMKREAKEEEELDKTNQDQGK